MADPNSTDDIIYLRTDPKYSALLNTYVRDFHYMGKVYKTAEHLFQALKFLDKGVAETIRQCNNPLTEATNSDNLNKKRVDWYVINKTVLKIALYQKSTEHEDLRELLLGTGSRKLINNVEDRFWGIGKKFDGRNQFGVVLEGLREEFAKPKTPDPPILPEPREPIRFYNKGEPYYDFTNFAPVPVYYEEEWKTSEHLFQAWKFPDDPNHVETIFGTDKDNPREVLRLGRKGNLRDDWDDIKIDVMTYIVYMKFARGYCRNKFKPAKKTLYDELADTEGDEIIENTPSNNSADLFWGCGANGTGRNELGKVLMRVRDIMLYGFPPPREPPKPPKRSKKRSITDRS